jgi:hypothetical protein
LRQGGVGDGRICTIRLNAELDKVDVEFDIDLRTVTLLEGP